METSLTPLEPVDERRLNKYEATIAKGLKSFFEVGRALLAIREERLYRATHATFEAYCQERWGIARRTAYQLMDAAEVVQNVRNCAQTLPANEAQARPLTALAPEEQRTAWEQAVATAPGGKVTATHVQAVVQQLHPPRQRQHRPWRVSDDIHLFYNLIDRLHDHWKTAEDKRAMAGALRSVFILLVDDDEDTPKEAHNDPS